MRRKSGALVLAGALALASIAAQAQAQPAGPAERLISVVGEGLVQARPDLATISAGVVTQAAQARQALAANTADMNRIIEALKSGGVESRDLQTSGFSVAPVTSQPPPGYDGTQPFEPKIVAYRVSNNVTVRIRDLAKTGDILDQIVALGANSVSGPAFEVAAPKAAQDEARRAAVADALAKGQLYAQAAGVALGPIARIEESGGSYPRPMEMMVAQSKAFDPAVPIEGGELTFQAQVSMSWRIGD